MATRPKAKKTRVQRRVLVAVACITSSVNAARAEYTDVVMRDVTRNPSPPAGSKNSVSFDGGAEALRAHFAVFRDDLMRLGDFLAARRMTRLLRDFDYLTRALQRSRV